MRAQALTKADLRNLEQVLRAQRAVLLEDTADLESQTAGQRGAAPEPQGDAAVVERDRTVDLALLGDEAALLGEVVAALDRLRDGTYGRCEDCGGALPRARLAVMPWARRCVRCEARAP